MKYGPQAQQVFDRDVLTGIAAGAGLDTAPDVIDGDAYAEEVRQDELQARELGVSGVPFFVFDMALGVSGAQPTEMFASALQQAWDRRG